MPSECFIFSSDPKNGAVNRSTDGSKFTVQFTNPFYLPIDARNAKLQVLQSNIWNVSPNISTELKNDILQISDNNGIHTINIQKGLYDIDTLYEQIAFEMDNIPLTRPVFPFKDMVSITGNESTSKLYITFSEYATIANLQFIWLNSSVRDIFGFNSTSLTKPVNPSTSTSSFSLESDNSPRFNVYNSYIIKSDLVTEGIRLNGNISQNIICQIPIKASVGELDVFRAQEPSVFALCNNLIGPQSQVWGATFELQSETGIPLDQRDEYYDFIILISWLDD
jgi:hypothetical protein